MAIAESSSSRRKRGVSYGASSRVQVLFRALLFALSLLLVACGGPAEPTPTTHTTGSLAITVQGLASGAAADIEVNGPGDFGANVGASTLLEELENELSALGVGQVVDGIGRGIALDRDGNYAKIKRAYDMMVHGEGTAYGD